MAKNRDYRGISTQYEAPVVLLKKWVDFSYSVNGQTYEFSLPGGGKIALSDLIEVLGIIQGTYFESASEFIAHVSDVQFSDESLVQVTQIEGDWELESLQTFTTEEELTITMDNGDIVRVRVTDAQTDGYSDLTDAALNTVLSVAINNSDSEGHQGSYNVYTQRYELNVKLQFNLDTDKITGAGGGHYFLKLGDGVTVPDSALNMSLNAYDSTTKEKSFEYKIVKDGDNYYLLIDYDSTYLNKIKTSGRSIDNNTINLDVEIGREKLEDGDGNTVHILDNVTVVIDPSKIDYPDNTDGKSDISVSKSGGTYDKTANTMKYYVTVYSAGGTENGISVEDVLSVTDGNTDLPVSGITVNSVKLTGTNASNKDWQNGHELAASSYNASVDGKQISITGLDKLGKNSKYEIEYIYNLDSLGNDFESYGTNKVTATTGSLKVDTSTGWQISQSGIAVGKNGTLSEDGKSIIWTITVTNNKGDAITLTDDALKNATNLTVKNSAGQDVAITRNDDAVVLPKGEGVYTITYETPAISSDPMKASNVSNKAVITDGTQTKDATGSVAVPAEAKASKEFLRAGDINDNKQDITWRVTIDVPQSGFAEGTEFKETMSLNLSNPWTDLSDHAKFTDEQYNAFINQLRAVFDDALNTTSEDYFRYTPAELQDVGYGNYNHQPAEIWWKLTKNWNGGSYAGKKIVLEYTTTLDLTDVAGKENLFTNTFTLGNTPVTADYSYKSNVTKKSEQGNSNDVTSKTVTRDNNKLHWIVEVHLDSDTREIVVNDTLPSGISEVIDIAMGVGENRGGDMAGLYSSDGVSWGTVSDWGIPDKWGKVVSPWQYTGIKEIIPSASISGNNVTITAKLPDGAEIPTYMKSGKNFYFYIEVALDDSNFPTAGKSAPVDYKNTVNVSLNGSPYGSDDQTQQVTFETDVIDKGGDSSNWNKDGFHELAYSIDINPGGGDLTGGKDIDITLDDQLSYNDTVYTYENGANVAHHVTVSLKGGSVKLQRKSGENWLDIPATEGWGYTLDEGKTDANGIKTKTISVYGIPNSVPLRLVYVYNVEVAGLEKNATVDIGVIKNTATLKGDGEWSDSHTENKQWQNVNSSASSDSSGALTLVKVQKGNYAVTLPNAYFVLEKYNESVTNKWEIINAIGSTATDKIDGTTYNVYKTDGEGQLIISHRAGFENDVLYRVREYKAPTGFSIDEDWVEADKSINIPETTGYFYFHTPGENEGEDWAATNLPGYNYNSRSKHADNLLEEVDTVYLGNERVTDTITAEKRWDGLTAWQDNISIILELRDKNGNKVNAPAWYSSDDNKNHEEWVNPQTLTSSNTSAKWEHVEGKLSDYQVVETEIRVGETPGVLTRVDDKESGRLTWTDKDGNIVYETWGGTVTNGMATIVNASRTELKVNKIFTNTNSVNDNTKVEFTLLSRERLYARNETMLSESDRNAQEWSDYQEVANKSKLILTAANSSSSEGSSAAWTGAFSNLEKFRFDEATGNLYELQYFAEEHVFEGEKEITEDYRVEYSPVRSVGVTSGELTVTNSPNLGKLIVKKEWVNKDGMNDAPQDSVIINLQRYVLNGSQKIYDAEFNRTHRNISLSASDIYSINGTETNWTKLFDGLQVSGKVYEEKDGKLTGNSYEGTYYYEVVEDTVTRFVAAYSADNVILSSSDDVTIPQVRITNTESVEFNTSKTTDIDLVKVWYDETGDKDWNERFFYPENQSATFRIYRYITIERGTYDLDAEGDARFVRDDENSEDRKLDADFNDDTLSENSQYSITLNTSDTTKQVDIGAYDSLYEGTPGMHCQWSDLPTEEIYVNNGTYVKYTYEYYVVETAYTGSYLQMYMSSGSAENPIIGANVQDDENPVVNMWNIVSDQLRVEKNWYRLNDEYMPPVVVRVVRNYAYGQIGTDDNGKPIYGYSDKVDAQNDLGKTDKDPYSQNRYWVTDAGYSDSGQYVLYNEALGGYVFNQSNDWSLIFTSLDQTTQNGEKISYAVFELGYLNTDGSIIPFNNNFFRTDRVYKFISNDSERPDEDGEFNTIINQFSEAGKGNVAIDKSVGTFLIWNIPRYKDSLQITAQKYWRTWDNGSYADLGSSYSGQLNGQGAKVSVTYQMEQRVKSVWNLNSGTWTSSDSEWMNYRDSFTVTIDTGDIKDQGFEALAQMNDWVTRIRELDLAKYGYLETESGYQVVEYEYRIKEVGSTSGSDGRTFTKYTISVSSNGQTVDSAGWEKADQARYYMMNLETGVLRIIKDWKLQEGTNPDDVKVYFTVKSSSTNMPDVAKKIYEDQDYSYYGLKRSNVTYVKELDEYCIVLSASDLNNASGNWDVLLKGLDILDPFNGMAEVTYEVAEVAIEKPVTITNEDGTTSTENKVIAITDNAFPYNATYYKQSRNDSGEQLAGTALGDHNEALSVGGLQINTPYAYDSNGNRMENAEAFVRATNDDSPVTSYTVTKTWAGDKFPDDSTKVTIELQQRIQDINADGTPKVDGDGNPVWFTDWQSAEGTSHGTIVLPVEGLANAEAWTYTWNKLPQYKSYEDVNGVYRPIWYRAVETSAPSWVDPIISDEGEKYSGESDSNYPGQKPANEGDILTQSILNDNGKTDLTVSKQWLKDGDPQDEWPANTEIDYKIVRHAYLISANSNEKGFEVEALKVDPVTTGTLSSSKQSATIEGLERGALYTTGPDAVAPLAPNFTYAVEYEYEVVETAVRVDGNTYSTKVSVTADADDPSTANTVEEDDAKAYAQIVNDLTDIKVVKTWTGDEGSNVVVQLYRSSQRPEGKVPVETFNLTVNVPNTNWTTSEGNSITDVPMQGEIIVRVESSDGQTREISLKDGNWTGTLNDLPRTTSSQAPIEYKISVKRADGTNILSATGGAEYVSVTGDVTINLHATVPEPILEETMTMVFKQTYWHNSNWQGANKPTSGSISLTVVASDGTEYPVQLTSVGKDNNYEHDSITVITKTKKGETVTFNKDNFVWHYDGDVLGIDSVNLKTENGKYVVEYQGKVKDNSSGGGEAQEKTTKFELVKEDGINVNSWNVDSTVKVGQNYTLYMNSLSGVSAGLVEIEVTGASNVIINKNNFNTCSVTFTPSSSDTPVKVRLYKNEPIVQLISDSNVLYSSSDFSYGDVVRIKITREEYWSGNWLSNSPSTSNSGNFVHGGVHEETLTLQIPAAEPLRVILPNNGRWGLKSATITAVSTNNLLSTMKAPAKVSAAGTKIFTESGANHLTVATENVTDSNGNSITRSTDRTPYGAESVGDPVTLSSGNWENTWSNLPKVDEYGNPIYYYVKEISATVPGNTSSVTTSYSYQKHDNDDARMGYKEVDISNSFETQDTFGNMTVQKVVEGLPASVSAGEFKVTITNSSGWYLNASGNLVETRTELTIRPGSGLSFTNLPVDTYTVTEITTGNMDRTSAGKTYTFDAAGSITTAAASVTAGGTATATITNKYTNSEEFTKTWKVGAETVTWPAGTTITVKVIQQAGETETGSALFTVSGSEAVTESIGCSSVFRVIYWP